MRDEKSWRAILRLAVPPAYVDTNVVVAGLSGPSPSISTDAAWYLAAILGDRATTSADGVAAALDAAGSADRGDAAQKLGYELLSRALGRERHDVDALWKRLKSDQQVWRLRGFGEEANLNVADGWPNCSGFAFARLMTDSERGLVCVRRPSRIHDFSDKSTVVLRAPFSLMTDLPPGVAAGVVSATSCRADWIGNVAAGAERSGRIVTFDVHEVDAPATCLQALRTLIPLTIADNDSISSPLSTAGVIVVKSEKAELCADEPPVSAAPFDLVVPPAPDVTMPVPRRRVEPQFSAEARSALRRDHGATVLVEGRVSDSGCVTPLRVLLAAPLGDINRAALLAFQQWRFKPAVWQGRAVPVLFDLGVTFTIN